MAYETKVILTAVADIVQTSSNLDEAYKRIARLANAEGVVLPPVEGLGQEMPNNPSQGGNAND
jgi:hypothetical protein